MARPTGHGGRDFPDYIQQSTPHENPVEITIAELAIRLGYPAVFERTGNLLYYETFEYGISDWFPLGSAADNYPVLAARGLLNSPYSCLLQINSGPAGYSQIAKNVAYPYLTTYGFELAFRPTDEFGRFMIGIQVYTGTYCHEMFARYDNTVNTWSIYTGVATWTVIATYPMGTSDISVWHPVKLVGDFDNLQYGRFSYDAEDVGLSSYALVSSASAVTPRLEIGATLSQVAAETAGTYVDNVILTMNEPI